MPRRVSLPGADELFRSTLPGGGAGDAGADLDTTSGPDADPTSRAAAEGETPDEQGTRGPSRPRSASTNPRERHDEKITVYISDAQLIELEQARLRLRMDHRLAVDRGRIVREALAVVLADLTAMGEQSILVRRLRG